MKFFNELFSISPKFPKKATISVKQYLETAAIYDAPETRSTFLSEKLCHERTREDSIRIENFRMTARALSKIYNAAMFIFRGNGEVELWLDFNILGEHLSFPYFWYSFGILVGVSISGDKANISTIGIGPIP
jgi:hypothetical protein